MTILMRNTFIVILVASFYHLVRDTLQIFDVNHFFVTIFHKIPRYCGPYCDYVTYPLDFLGIIGSYIPLRRNRVGITGVTVLFSMPLWIVVTVLP